MPRTIRGAAAGIIYHVLNRGNGRMRLFHKPADYEAFERVLAEACQRYPVEILTYCLMPNHWHLVLRPKTDAALSRFMGWVGVTHVRRHHAHYHTAGGGHLYQGRYKSFPVQEDDHFLRLCRYVEANPARAKLVERAAQWRWCGLRARSLKSPAVPLSAWSVERPGNWSSLVNAAMPESELSHVQTSLQRGRPLGEADWVSRTARRLGLESTLRPRGRPRKERKE